MSAEPANRERGKLSPEQASNLWQRLLGGHREEIKPEHNSWAHFLPEGCRRCLLGGRLCLTVGEKCPKDCFYCSNPMGSDLVRADEFTIHSDDDLLRLVRFSAPDAVCLTGGEPTLYLDRAEHYARLLREECGPDFHIQFFTANASMTGEQMARMRRAGVDEIRCHLASHKEARLVERAREFDWTVAVEIQYAPTGTEDWTAGRVALALEEQEVTLEPPVQRSAYLITCAYYKDGACSYPGSGGACSLPAQGTCPWGQGTGAYETYNQDQVARICITNATGALSVVYGTAVKTGTGATAPAVRLCVVRHR